MSAVVQQQLERLTTIKQEVQELRRRRLQQQQEIFCRRYQDRLEKVEKLWRAAGGAVLLSCYPNSELLLVSFRPCRTWKVSPSCWTPAR